MAIVLVAALTTSGSPAGLAAGRSAGGALSPFQSGQRGVGPPRLTSGGDEPRGEVEKASLFERIANYPMYWNSPAGEDPAAATVAEILAITEDGKTVVYTDADGQRIGFLDITDPGNPTGRGILSLGVPGAALSEPTSVAVVGQYALVVVNTSASYAEPSGRLDVIKMATRERVRSLDLGGQPDSIAISPDQRHAVVAIENERDETAAPSAGAPAGDLPQSPAGFLQVVDLPTGDPGTWSTRRIPLTGGDGSALPMLVRAGIAEPTDPEPEYVSINAHHQVAVTLQENNGIVVVDARTGRIRNAFHAGTSTITGIDTRLDDAIDQSGFMADVPREPDAVGWVDDRYLATADEGDWRGGTRAWSIFDSRTGNVVWDAGNSVQRLAVRYGLHDERHSEDRGVEPEGIVIAEFHGVHYAFVGMEHGNFTAVYELSQPTRPVFRQILPTGIAPEGLLAIPHRDLLVVSSDPDDEAVGARADVTLFRFGDRRPPTIPSLRSANDELGKPIGWGALSGLSGVPGRPGWLYTVTDAHYRPTRVLTVDARRAPATITRELVLKDAAGTPVGYDAEGVYARPQGGFWLVSEGTTGSANQLVLLDRHGVTCRTIGLPVDVADRVGEQGLHGVTAVTDRRGAEQVWITLRRELTGDPAGVIRLGRFDVATGAWAWFGYRLHGGADRTGVTEVTAIGPDILAVIEQDDLAGPAAKIKKIYLVRLPSGGPVPGILPVLPSSLAYDVLPDLRATHGWTPDKLEGFAIDSHGTGYVVTDNDAMAAGTGETVFLRLGRSALRSSPGASEDATWRSGRR